MFYTRWACYNFTLKKLSLLPSYKFWEYWNARQKSYQCTKLDIIWRRYSDATVVACAQLLILNTKCVYQDGRGDEEDAGGVHEVRERDQRVRAAGDVPLVAHPRARPRQPGRRQRDDRGHQRDGVHQEVRIPFSDAGFNLYPWRSKIRQIKSKLQKWVGVHQEVRRIRIHFQIRVPIDIRGMAKSAKSINRFYIEKFTKADLKALLIRSNIQEVMCTVEYFQKD